jgi:hypothetical protein
MIPGQILNNVEDNVFGALSGAVDDMTGGLINLR